MNLKISCGIKTIGNNEDATKSPQYGVEVFFYSFLSKFVCFHFCQDWCFPGVMEILGSWVVGAARAAIFPRTSRDSTGRECARLNVEHSSLWHSLNLELFGPGEMDECDSDSSGHSTVPPFLCQ